MSTLTKLNQSPSGADFDWCYSFDTYKLGKPRGKLPFFALESAEVGGLGNVSK